MSILKQVMEEKLSETPINGTGTVPKITVITSQFDKNSREIYEIGAQYSVASFERYMFMLKSFYTNQSVALPKSSKMYEMLGLNILSDEAESDEKKFELTLDFDDENGES